MCAKRRSELLVLVSRGCAACGIFALVGAILLSSAGLAVASNLKTANESEAEETERNIEVVNGFRATFRRFHDARDVDQRRVWPNDAYSVSPGLWDCASSYNRATATCLVGSGIRIRC